MGRHVSLASSGASRGTDERTLVANLGSSPDVAQLTLFMDGRGDPFGTKKTTNAAGQAKSLHLTPFMATVQRGAEVVQLLSLEPLGSRTRYKPGELSCFLTHLTIPKQAEIWIGDARTLPGTPQTPVVVPAHAAVFLRIGNAAIAIRFLLANSVSGNAAPLHLISDAAKIPAVRLTALHATTEPRGRGTVAVWLRAAENLDDAQFGVWRQSFVAAKANARLANNVATLEIAGEAGPIRIEADLARDECRVVSGGEPEAVLSVNGRDLGREVLGDFVQR